MLSTINKCARRATLSSPLVLREKGFTRMNNLLPSQFSTALARGGVSDKPAVTLNMDARDLQWARDHPLVLIQHMDIDASGHITPESMHRILGASGLSEIGVESLMAKIGGGGEITVNDMQRNMDTFVSALGQAKNDRGAR